MTLHVGIDLVDVDDVAATLARFGDRYLRRVFVPAEIAACAAGTDPRLLSACFAAKEATLKALGLGEAPADWRSIEVSLPGRSPRCERRPLRRQRRDGGRRGYRVPLGRRGHDAGPRPGDRDRDRAG